MVRRQELWEARSTHQILAGQGSTKGFLGETAQMIGKAASGIRQAVARAAAAPAINEFVGTSRALPAPRAPARVRLAESYGGMPAISRQR